MKGTEGGERREDTEGQRRETSWVSGTKVRDEMGCRDRGERRDGFQGPSEARDDTEGQRRGMTWVSGERLATERERGERRASGCEEK